MDSDSFFEQFAPHLLPAEYVLNAETGWHVISTLQGMIKNIEDVSCAFLHDMDLVCFSHLRWDFVFQRPQHLLTRFAKHQRVFFIEEPICCEEERLQINHTNDNIYVVTPFFKHGLSPLETAEKLRGEVDKLFQQMKIEKFMSWYYTPMAIPFTRHLSPELVVYDCMDELSAFKFAPQELTIMEKELLGKSDVVFTGGLSIYESKQKQHHNIYPFPSSIDKKHFGKAREACAEPVDQANIPHPRLGFFGVIDERFDIDLIAEAAKRKPEWQFVILGPTVKIDPETLPKYANIHYLGKKCYEELPQYIASWDIALVPFAMNESTKFISPTKTPEYLAAGKPVISTPIKDVIRPYGEKKLVHIVNNADEFIAAGEKELNKKSTTAWLAKTDEFLTDNSWDRTWSRMVKHIETCLQSVQATEQKQAYV